MGDFPLGVHGFGLGFLESCKGTFRPRSAVLGSLLFLYFRQLLGVVTGLRKRRRVLYFPFRGLYFNITHSVETGPSRPTRDLVEFPGGEVAFLGSVKLNQGSHHHRADWNIDSHAQSIRPRNRL